MSCWKHMHLYYNLHFYLKVKVSTDSEHFKNQDAVRKEAEDEARNL